MTINRDSGEITVDLYAQITNLIGIILDMSPIEVNIENQLYREISKEKDTNYFTQIRRCNLCNSQQVFLGNFAIVLCKRCTPKKAGTFHQWLFKEDIDDYQSLETE